MTENGYDATSVGDVLEETGFSTRAFYRHFDSKHALLMALIERERDRVGLHLDKAVKSAIGPLAAVEAWVDAFLDLLYDPEIAPTTAIFTAPSVLASYTLATSLPEMQRVFCPPLARALRAGHRAGVLQSSRPEADAYCIHALVHAALDVYHRPRPKRAMVKGQIMRFTWPALGIPLRGQTMRTGRGRQPTAKGNRAGSMGARE
jgi:AcrR family transcriptional regulator